MSDTTIRYRHLEPTELTRPPEGLPYRVIAAMNASGQFGRSTRGVILYAPDGASWMPLIRAPEIVAALRESLTWEGDPVPDEEWKPIAWSVSDIRFRLILRREYVPGTAANSKRGAAARPVRA